MADQFYMGTDLKVLIEMEAPGFSMADDDWEVILKSGSKILKTYTKEECVVGSDGEYYICVRADIMRRGSVDIAFHALVPDEDWDDGIRNETDKQHFAKILKI